MAELIVSKEEKELQKIKGMNIYEKMMLITDEVGVVEKNLKVQVTKNSSYQAVSERDILDKVKPIEKKYRVYSYPFSRQIIENDTLVKKNDYGESNQFYLRLQTIYRFINIDEPDEYIDITTYGDGIDTGDKATGKAMTYADKYALMKAYKISTGDDPDKDPSPEKVLTKQKPKVVTKEQTQEELENMIDYEYQQALRMSGQDEKEMLGHYGVESADKLTLQQKKEAIVVMKTKIKKAKSILEEASEQLKEEGLE